MYINLVLAVFWLVLGLALLFMNWRLGAMEGRGEGFSLSGGWVALLLAAYNVLRFLRVFSLRAWTQQAPALERRALPATTPKTYDTAFEFSKPSAEEDEVREGKLL